MLSIFTVLHKQNEILSWFDSQIPTLSFFLIVGYKVLFINAYQGLWGFPSSRNKDFLYRPYFWSSSDCHWRLRSGNAWGILILRKSRIHCFISSSALGLSRVFLRVRPLPPLSRGPTPLVRDWKSSLFRLLSGNSIHCTEEPFLDGRPSVRVLGGRDTECRAPHGARDPPTTLPRETKMGPWSWGEVASEWVSELEVESSLSDAPLSLALSSSFSHLGSSLGDADLQADPGEQNARVSWYNNTNF